MNIDMEKTINGSWENYFSNEEKINDLLQKIDLDDYRFKKITNNYFNNSNRYGVLIEVIENSTEETSTFIIDVRHGEISWEQLMDCAFDYGGDCENRIILYDEQDYEDKFSFGYYFDDLIAVGVAKHCSCNKKNIYLVKVLNSMDEDSFFYEYDLLFKPDGTDFKARYEIISKSDFEKAVFTAYNSDIGMWAMNHLTRPEYWFIDYEKLDEHGLEFSFYWNQYGYYIDTFFKELDLEKFIEFLAKHISLLGCFIQILNRSDAKLSKMPGNKHKFTFNLSNQPISYFYNATAGKKREIVENLSEFENIICRFVKDIAYQIDRENCHSREMAELSKQN